MKDDPSFSGGRQGRPRPFTRPPHRPQSSFSQRASPSPCSYYRTRKPHDPVPPPPLGPNFTIELRLRHRPNHRCRPSWPEIEALIAKCEPAPDKVASFHSGEVIATLSYSQWTHAREVLLCLWRSRLEGGHSLSPELRSPLLLPSDGEELNGNLKALFLATIDSLEGEQMKKWKVNREGMSDELARIQRRLRGRNSPRDFNDLREKQIELSKERELGRKRILEFKAALNCIRAHLGESHVEDQGSIPVFKFESGDFDWNRIHRLLLRECKRLDDGLPIYVYRRDILEKIHNHQVIVLRGETGSGKSTQLAQYIADSGLAIDSIVCTQPRKIAAASLAERVKEESTGCYDGNSVICQPSFSSSLNFSSSKLVVYMTDHCLLQHYMQDRSLTGISCIIIDEAHERSLSTDLLLAMIKELLCKRPFLRLVIMSATADAKQLSDYYFECHIMHVEGRNFPVDIRYVTSHVPREGSYSGTVASYVSEAVMMAKEVHETEKEGTILTFLTSQMEVEWACENFVASSAVALPLHGKLSHEEQHRIFQKHPGKRKVIFATNLAETSLTIPGVRYVIDSGMVKESKFEPATGMNVLRVCTISKSSAEQRAGRAGRTEPGVCYRLYSESDFESMPNCQEPEIRRVHLGVAVLRILALGIKNMHDFDFVDAPSDTAIDMAVRNLVQLGAIALKNDVYELTGEGRYLVKLAVEPRLGKLIYSCCNRGLEREGVVLAAVMANASSIFCRVGTDMEKLRSDSLKVQFCHRSGDLFTLLSVYKEWEAIPREKRNMWCWENSINAKSMRRCQETIQELQDCLRRELRVVVPYTWRWDSHRPSEIDRYLKRVILSCLSENVAMYSGHDRLGYEVALTRQRVQLHPSSSLLVFGQKPAWVVFGEILSLSHPYLVCVTAIEFDSLSELSPPLLFDPFLMKSRKLQVGVITGFGKTLLRKFCGKYNCNLINLETRFREDFSDERISILVDVDLDEVSLFAPSQAMHKFLDHVNDSLEWERKWLHIECVDKCLYQGHGTSVPVALLGAGAEIKHLELEKRFLSVDICHQNVRDMDDKELLLCVEKYTCGSICGVHKFPVSGHDNDDKERWGRITFLTPGAAKRALELNGVEFRGARLKLSPSQMTFGSDRSTPFPAVKARLYWPRRKSKGIAFVQCRLHDVGALINHFSGLIIGGKSIRCQISNKRTDSVLIAGIPTEVSENEALNAISKATNREILDFFLVRGDAVENPPISSCEEAILKEVSPFMPKGGYCANQCRVQVFPPEPKDVNMKATVTFDGRLHLEAAKALEHIDGKVLPGCLIWQKIRCQQMFYSSLSCPTPVYYVIKDQLDGLLSRLNNLKGVELSSDTQGSCFRVKISANATKTVAEVRAPLEALMRGKTINNASLNSSILQVLFSRNGIGLMTSIQKETGTYILFDRYNQNVRIFGSSEKVSVAEQKLIKSLLDLHESKQLEIHMRGRGLPPDLMKEVVKLYGPDLQRLKEKVPGAEFTLNVRHHVISIRGDKDMKQKVDEIISGIIAQMTGDDTGERAEKEESENACPVCLCEVEDSYQLEGCSHCFCRSCLVEQCESAIKNLDILPLQCSRENCRAPILITDLKSLLSADRLEELFWASLRKYVTSSGGTLRFCPSPDCPSVYRVASPGKKGDPFVCGACFTETCTRCHLEYHPDVSCERYKEFKEDPDLSLKDWCRGKENVKVCPSCGYTIEKREGCNHITCRCERHICWNCLESFNTSDDCYNHMRTVHLAID